MKQTTTSSIPEEVIINQITRREGIRGEGPSLRGQEVQMMKAGPGVSRLREGTERKGSMLGGAGTGRTPVPLRNSEKPRNLESWKEGRVLVGDEAKYITIIANTYIARVHHFECGGKGNRDLQEQLQCL